MRALQQISKNVFFAAESGAYRYWYNHIAGVLKIQINREALKRFRESEVGKRLDRFIDLFEIGGGWYEVRGGDTSQFDRFGTHTDGLKMWVRAFNTFHLSGCNANQHPHQVVYKSRVPSYMHPPVYQPGAPSQAQLNALQARFARSH